jgi:hypothetical protein
MPAPNKVARKLNESLGVEAGDAMVDWMNGVEENTRELRADIAELQHQTKVEFAQLRQDMNSGLAEARQDMNTGFATVRQDMNTGFAAVRQEMRVGFANVEATAAKRHADFMKWTLGFWVLSLVTLVGAIVGLAQVLP